MWVATGSPASTAASHSSQNCGFAVELADCSGMPICTTRGWFLYLSISRSAPLMSSGLTRIVPRKRSPSSGCSSQRDTIISLCAARDRGAQMAVGHDAAAHRVQHRHVDAAVGEQVPRDDVGIRSGVLPSGPREP